MTGILCVNKPSGMTSFDVCRKIRYIFGEKKVGHTGTLDPMAEGVLVIMLGGATKFLDYMPSSEKIYEAGFIIGKDSNTYDIEGNITGEINENVSSCDIENIIPKFTGDILQEPPMFSAKSIDGKRLYALAREGIEVEREKCQIHIERIDLLEYEKGIGKLRVSCSKGTYIRSLIHDMGIELSTSAIMSSLKRVKTSGFDISNSYTLDELENMSSEELDRTLVSVEKAFETYEKIKVSPAQSVRFANGGALDKNRLKITINSDEMYRIYSSDDVFIGLGKGSDTELLCQRLLTRRD